MKHIPIAVFAIAFFLLGADKAVQTSSVSVKDIGRSLLILGDLGLPVGQETTITGRKRTNGPLQGMFIVDTIDGKRAPAGVSMVMVDGIENWPDGTKATLRGNEVGLLRFLQLDDANLSRNDPRWKGPYQHLSLSFHVSEVVEPAGLKIEPKR